LACVMEIAYCLCYKL